MSSGDSELVVAGGATPVGDPRAARTAHPVDVVVVTHNSAHVVGDLLDSLPDALGGLPAQVVVVDNGSSDDTVRVVRGRDDCRLVTQANTGYAAGINRGVQALGGAGPILVLNPDVRLMPGSVRSMVALLEQAGAGIVAPRVLYPDGTLEWCLRREPTLLRAIGLGATGRPGLDEFVRDPLVYERPQVADWALGAVLLVSRTCHEALHGWDESYFLYGEETDFCLRARDLGLATCYDPDATAVHIGGQSGQSTRTHVMQIVNRVRLYRRRHGSAPSSLYLALAVLSELSWIVRGNPASAEAVRALLSPRRRPGELGCSDRLLPR